MLTPGQRHDSKVVPELLEGLSAKALIADKAYDSNEIVQIALAQGMQAIIPCKANRKEQRILDKHRYKARHLVENLFQRMKVFRRVATRFDKLDIRFMGFVHLAGIMKWIHWGFLTAPNEITHLNRSFQPNRTKKYDTCI